MNRKKFKTLRILVVTALITALFSLTAFAGWEYEYGDWYYYDDYSGYYLANQWVGNYYLGSDGAMLINSWTPDGYYVGSDGEWTGQSIYNTGNYYSYGNSFETSSGRYFGITYADTYTNSYVASVSIDGDILTVVGSLEYTYDPDGWGSSTTMAYDTYQFQLYSGTQYMIIDEEVHYVTKSQFMNMYGPVLSIVVSNGVVTEVYYSA
ncbi:hypothetical protein [Oribacterium sp. P6A1]|uniref:hypothetical protein n=1 Tax=Oribacterium sp. P6A1 TaxID=1410612 RepID=UPI00068FB9D3|nr:hypothetical protein [Oribacterium sp. P6A1]